MKNFTKSVLFVMCLSVVLLTLGAVISNAQVLRSKTSKSVKNILSEIVREKSQNKPFTIITPDDLAKLPTEDVQMLLSGGDPCDSASFIDFGQTLNGQLASTDCRLPDNSYADFYIFNGTQGQQVTINLSSTAFDTYLAVANEAGTFTMEDDNGGGGTNSRIIGTLPSTGLYVILANSAFPNQFGNYSVSLTGSTVCTYSLEPSGATIPAAGGTFTFTVTTQPNCSWTASTDPYPYFISSSSGGVGSGTVTYTVTPNNTGAARSGIIRINGQQIFTVSQTFLVCTYSISPTSANVPATQSIQTFTIDTPAGCFWSAQANHWFLSTNNSGTGPATITYTVAANNGADRTGTITVAGLTFTVNQPGLNCTFSVSPTNIYTNRADQNGTIAVTTQPGCFWSASRSDFWMEMENTAGNGSGTISYRLYANNSGTRTGVITVYGNANMNVTITQTGFFAKTRFDYDKDGWADISVWRPSNRVWYIHNSLNGVDGSIQFGLSDDTIAPADYDGDGKTDIAVFRPSTGVWYWINSSTNSASSVAFGASGDIPVPADYDGDGKDDVAIYRPSTGNWWITRSIDNAVTAQQFGSAEDKPTLGDFDGDGKNDLAVWRPSNGVWYRLNSSNGQDFAYQFGISEDKPTAADYDGDGKTDIAVYRPSSGVWYIYRSLDGAFAVYQFGLTEDNPTPADYDGDGKADIAVFRPSTGVWYMQRTRLGFMSQAYGVAGDKPAANAFVP